MAPGNNSSTAVTSISLTRPSLPLRGRSFRALVLAPGTSLHVCGDRAETLFVTGGRGRLRVGADEYPLVPETGFFLAAGEEAELDVEGELRLVRALAPPAEPTTARAVTFEDEVARDAGIGREFRLLACSSETTQFIGIVPPGRALMHNHPYDEVAYIVEQSGVSQKKLEEAAQIFIESERTIFCWAMGLTQHRNAVANIQEIVNLMLAQLLEFRGYCATSVSQSSLASEMVEQVEQLSADLVVVSALPPSAVAHGRYLCKRVHQRFPEIRMIVGLWTYRGDLGKARDRITCVANVRVATTLADMQHEIDQLAQPLLTRGAVTNVRT